ncbi:phytoene synthase 2, chloroplastic [Physcomitrium patens]|uniref:15-cis-phytoene synthase n=1 Tax=Physcomitrium patens TaxID=3218 RepID=A0A2K1IH22_PHYPA|nr:phytoene synthase 2, chloroplastic-like [Physcomitrium patens]PNR28571.1 hypothetical protein PHYPA_029163 [Physcomitrium patens]|eukprot:XP_024364025.1 phytoene synthase 2, chloroplastic-like [Physcomitrella patens]
MQAAGLHAVNSTASPCWREMLLVGASSCSGDGNNRSALLALKGGLRTSFPGGSSSVLMVPRAVLSQRQEASSRASARAQSSLLTEPLDRNFQSAEQRVHEAVAKQVAIVEKEQSRSSQNPKFVDVRPDLTPVSTLEMLEEAYTRCGEVCAEYAKTFYLGTKLMTPERQRAIWAIYVWCRRTDELVDGPNASRITPTALDRWEDRLEDIFCGQPYDMLDAALADTVSKFPVDIQPFRDMIDGMRMDLVKSRYANFDELYLYCYNVAGTVGLMSVPIMGIDPESKATTQSVYNGALALGIANQLTNILRDVGEDARRGRVYLPQDELARFGLTDEDIFAGKVTDKWRAFMKDQIKRARMFFVEAEQSVLELDKDSRWPVWSALLLYQQILDAIEANDYDNFTKRAYVNKWKKFATLPMAYGRALLKPPGVQARSAVQSL